MQGTCGTDTLVCSDAGLVTARLRDETWKAVEINGAMKAGCRVFSTALRWGEALMATLKTVTPYGIPSTL